MAYGNPLVFFKVSSHFSNACTHSDYKFSMILKLIVVAIYIQNNCKLLRKYECQCNDIINNCNMIKFLYSIFVSIMTC